MEISFFFPEKLRDKGSGCRQTALSSLTGVAVLYR
jgi:hypothetical protein